MSDSAVARVLWALERVASELLALELAERTAGESIPLPSDSSTIGECRAYADDALQRLGRTEGLVAAQEVVTGIRREYARKHRAASSGHQSRVLAALVEEGPTGSASL